MAWSVIPSLEDLHLSHCCICVAFVMYRRMWQSYPNLMSAPLLPPSSWHNKHLLAMRCPLPLHIRATKNYFIPSWTNYFGSIGDEINFSTLSVKMWRAITNFQNSMSSTVFFMLASFFFSQYTTPADTVRHKFGRRRHHLGRVDTHEESQTRVGTCRTKLSPIFLANGLTTPP